MSVIGFNSKYGKWNGLSNMSMSYITIDNKFYRSVEHYYQASKFEDEELHDKIRKSNTSFDARDIGTSKYNSHLVRPDWHDIRLAIMYEALVKKFSIPCYRELLLSTEDDTLVHTAPWDNYWGTGKTGNGRNMLGKLLMKIRNDIKAGIL